MTTVELLEKLHDREAELSIAREQNAVLREANLRLKSENEQLQRRVDALCHRLYGKKAEHVNPAQLALAFAEIEREDAAAKASTEAEAQAAPEADTGEPLEAPKPAPRKGHGRSQPAQNLVRERVETLPPADQCVCSTCNAQKVRIGEEVSEQYERVPASLKVIQYVRVKMACPTCKDGVVVGPPAEKVVDKGLAGPGLVAHTIVSKFGDHLPLYRQSEMLEREGAHLSDSTLLSFVNQGAALLAPIAKAVLEGVLARPFLHADETPVKMKLAPSGTKTAYLWTYTDREQVAFRFTTGRGQEWPLEVLHSYRGYVHRDAYAGYEAAMREGGAIYVACWAHARRGFYEALRTDPTAASRMLAMIRLLYAVETDANGLDDDARKALRQERSMPILARIEAELEALQRTALPKSPLGEAVTYARNQWPGLIRYVEHGMLAIDNNAAERALRPVGIGRKNWMLAGSEDGGHRAAICYTLVGSCKLLGVDPVAYLRDVLTRVGTHPARRVAELTPKAWKAARDLAR